MEHRGKGITPIVTIVIMFTLVMALASGSIYFLTGQQDRITNRLSSAMDEQLEVNNVVCNDNKISFHFSNQGEARIGSGEVDMLVYREGKRDMNFSVRRIKPEGDYLKPGGEGFLNVSTDGVFRSGTLYKIELDFIGSRSKFSKLCRAGQEWWNLNWDYRRQIEVSGPPEVLEVTYTEVDTESIMQEGKLNSDCSDIRVVEDQKIITYNVTNCGSPNTKIYFETLNMGEGTDYDTYLYYGNLRAEDKGVEDVLEEINRDISTELGTEEELDY